MIVHRSRHPYLVKLLELSCSGTRGRMGRAWQTNVPLLHALAVIPSEAARTSWERSQCRTTWKSWCDESGHRRCNKSTIRQWWGHIFAGNEKRDAFAKKLKKKKSEAEGDCRNVEATWSIWPNYKKVLEFHACWQEAMILVCPTFTLWWGHPYYYHFHVFYKYWWSITRSND